MLRRWATGRAAAGGAVAWQAGRGAAAGGRATGNARRQHIARCDANAPAAARRPRRALTRARAARAGVEVTLRAAADAWAEGAAAVAERLAQLRGLMRKYSGPADPAAELLALLACGRLSNALHQFLSANLGAPPPPPRPRPAVGGLHGGCRRGPPRADARATRQGRVCAMPGAALRGCAREPAGPRWAARMTRGGRRAGEGGVRRLAKAVDGAAGAAAGLLAEHALPALEAAAFQLGELRGLAACGRWAAPLGLQARARPSARPAAL